MYYPDDPGAEMECIACPECPLGLGLIPQCGTKITNYTTIKCEPCQQNKTYSDKHGIESCSFCHDCGLRDITQQRTPSQNRKCGIKCPERHFLDDNGFCQECYFCCPNVEKTGRMKKCKEIGMGEDWQCPKNHRNKLCKKALETSTEASVVRTYATSPADPLLPGHNFAANQTDSTSSDNIRRPTSSSENIARERKIIVGIIIVITLVLIFAVVFGVKRYITHRNSSPVQSEGKRESYLNSVFSFFS